MWKWLVNKDVKRNKIAQNTHNAKINVNTNAGESKIK